MAGGTSVTRYPFDKFDALCFDTGVVVKRENDIVTYFVLEHEWRDHGRGGVATLITPLPETEMEDSYWLVMDV